MTHWKRLWCWERLKAGGEGDYRGWDGWMASPTSCTWVWASSRNWWWTGKPGVLQSMVSQRVGQDWATELTDWAYYNAILKPTTRRQCQTLQVKGSVLYKTACFTCKLHFEGFQVTWWRRQWHPTPVLLPGKFHGLRSLIGCSPWGRQKSDTTERVHFEFSLSCIGEGNGNPLQYYCLENPRDWGAWWAAVSGVSQSQTRLKWLSSSSSSSPDLLTGYKFMGLHYPIRYENLVEELIKVLYWL